MNRSYDDIISRIPEPPLWWQAGGIPRYDAFDPFHSTASGTSEVALVEIACQATGIRFAVAFEGGRDRAIAAAIRDFSLFYGDPPNVEGVVPHMSSETNRVLQYWYSNHPEYIVDGVITDYHRYAEWKRDSSLEVQFPDADEREGAVYWHPRMFGNAHSGRPPTPPPSIRQWLRRFLNK